MFTIPAYQQLVVTEHWPEAQYFTGNNILRIKTKTKIISEKQNKNQNTSLERNNMALNERSDIMTMTLSH